ncbi:MAG: outer membrane protein assembly factor BamD [Bacteroidota bacterium]|jgi:outer membrane protein assembly factor BamD
MNSSIRLLFFIPVFFILLSCDGYRKASNIKDTYQKYLKAREYYDKNDFYHSSLLFEELIPLVKGDSLDEKVYFYYTYSVYNMGDYALAGFHFRSYVSNYPQSKHSEECSFMSAYCYYLHSPNYSLDQSDTKSAILELQGFINDYPMSNRIDSATILISKLRGKLELKYYEIVKQFFHINDYKAAITACQLFAKDFPDSKYVEEINLINIRSNYLLAVNSVEKKKLERINLAIETYQKFVDLYPRSKWVKDAEVIYESCVKMKNNLLKED